MFVSNATARAIHHVKWLKEIFNPDKTAGLSKPGKSPLMINESGLYSLILASKLPTAKKFKKWITREVIPSIRKTGVYKVHEEYDIFDLDVADDLCELAECFTQIKELTITADFKKELREFVNTDYIDNSNCNKSQGILKSIVHYSQQMNKLPLNNGVRAALYSKIEQKVKELIKRQPISELDWIQA